MRKLEQIERSNHIAQVASVAFISEKESFVMQPELRTYDRGEMQPQTAPEVAIRPGILTDIYVTLAGAEADGSAVGIKVMVNPLVNWIWIGGALLTLGGLVCMLPTGRKTVVVPEAENAAAAHPAPVPVAGKSKRERQRARAMAHPTTAARD